MNAVSKLTIHSAALLIFLFSACSDNGKTDEELLERDKVTMQESLDSYKIDVYKLSKIALRSAFTEDNISSDFQSFKSDLNWIYNNLLHPELKKNEQISVFEYLNVYKMFVRIQTYAKQTDEDIFPTLTEVIYFSIKNKNSKERSFLGGSEKLELQNKEHALLAVLALTSARDKEIALYECSKTNPDLITKPENKALIQLLRGYVFLQNGLYYLSENEFSNNIAWLNANPKTALPMTRYLFIQTKQSDQKAYTFLHAINHLFRGLSRMYMTRDIDEERALEDFEIFLKDAKEIGLDGELIWLVETFVYLKNDDIESAIKSLEKLKTSKLLDTDEIQIIDESISHLKQRNPDKVLNKLYDNIFMSKIALKYLGKKLAEVDWQEFLRNQKVQHVTETFSTLNKLVEFNQNLMRYASGEKIEETTNELKNTGEEYWNKLKEVVE